VKTYQNEIAKMSAENGVGKRLWVEEFNTPWIAFGPWQVDSVERHGAFVMCRGGGGDVELVLLDFEEAVLAARFELEQESGATIYVEEDYTLNAAPKELQEEYELAQLSGDEDRLEEVLTELWEEYGVNPDKDPAERETGGIQRLPAITDDYAHVVGFERQKREVNRWLKRHRYRYCRFIQFF
jgi:hypothetical protein